MIFSSQLTAKSLVRGLGSLLALGIFLVYWNSRHGAFLFDDIGSIANNPTIQNLHDVRSLLHSPTENSRTVGGRPVVNVSLAINYALGGLSPEGYHLTNALIHAVSTLLLFGLLRRTFIRPRFPSEIRTSATPLAFAVAALWGLHPLQTESVSYIVQRAESLAGSFCLLTLYAFVRANDEGQKNGWAIISALSCLVAMATKEIAAALPLLVWLYDRTFVSGRFRSAWAHGRVYYAGLFASWSVLGWLIVESKNHGNSAGFGVAGISWWDYLLTQCHAILHYVRLAAVPYPLVFDYGRSLTTDWKQAAIPGLVLVIGLFGTVHAVIQKKSWGMLGAWFFLFLAPSSSIVPIATQTVAEHRMYLPLAALIVGFVLGSFHVAGRLSWFVFGALGFLYAGLTINRNTVYRDPLSIWGDTVMRQPQNARAHHNLAVALAEANRLAESVAHDQIARRLDPTDPEVYYDLGLAASQRGNAAEAAGYYRSVLRLDSNHVGAHVEFAQSLLSLGQIDAAREQNEAALRLSPKNIKARNQLAYVYVLLGKPEDAIVQFNQILVYRPNDADALYNLGNTYFAQGRLDDAEKAFRASLRTRADDADTLYNLGNTLARSGRRAEAIDLFRRALKIRPDFPAAQSILRILESTAPPASLPASIAPGEKTPR